MIKKYSRTNSILNFKFFFCITLIVFFFNVQAYSQCATPIVGCPGTDLTNFGADSNNNAATIEYDNYVSSFHTTVVRTATGSFQAWGEKIANDGVAHVYSPLTINPTNFPALDGPSTPAAIPLKVGLGSSNGDTTQGIVLATDGLYAWSTEGSVLDATITSSAVFQKLTIGGNSNGLPTGVTPADVKMMFVTYQTIAITTCGGDVWVISQNANVRGNGATGNSTTWYRVTTTAAGNPFLDSVVACRGAAGTLMALKSDGTVYIWGTNVYRGNATAIIANQNRAIQMTLPAGITPKMVGSTVNFATSNHSYYVLATDGNLYALGENGTRQLGDWTTTARTAWVQPRYTSAAGPVMNNIKWISPQEHSNYYAFANVINSSNNLYAFGSNDGSCIGTAANPSNPAMPNGLFAADSILAVESGGHTSMVVKNCTANFGYVGHRSDGSMGSGSTGTGTEASYTFATANVQICGAESIPVIQPVTAGNGPTSNYCAGSSVLLAPSPSGGTLIVLSGPGTLAGNLLNFTGLGTIVVQYTLPTACGGTSVVTRNFATEYCSEDLQVVKTVNNPNPSVGSNVTFTITATNNGPYNTYGVSVNDVLPAGYAFVSATPSIGTWTAPNWTIGNMANGATATLTVVATVQSTGSYANTATITGIEPDSNLANNTSTSTPIVQANLSVVKTVSNPTPTVGSNVTFTITAGNAGASNATGVVINDVLPAGYAFVSATPSTGIWSAPNWTIGNLANGASATLTIVATVNAAGPYANTATISGAETDPTPGNNTSTVTPVPVAQTNLSVVKTVSNPTPTVGSNVTFTITAGNAGASNATGVVINDVLPAGYAFVSATPSTGIWSAPNWTIGNLANGASATLTIVATVNAAGPYANTATISGAETDPTPGNNTSTVTPVPVAQTNLSVVKTVSNPTPTVGSNVTFTITAGNAGASNATGVVINDVLPAGYAFVSATPSTGIWSAPNWTIGNLANGASATLTIVATVNAAGPYANTATISGAETDPTPGNNTSTVTPVPVAQTNLSVVKTVSNPTPTVGSNVTFTITAGNAGASNATGVVINDVLPAGYAFVSATPSTGIWSAPNWTIGNLANGASATLTIVATVNAAGPYANTATISGAETDPTPGNNTSTVTPVPVAQTNLSVVKTVSNPTPNVGSNVTFTITAGNAGASNATGVVINDVLPAGYAFVSATPSTGTWSAPNWTIGNLANGASATLTIVATVNAAGPYANTATISGAETDPTPGNNTSTVTPVPVAQTNLSVVKTVSNPTPTVGSNVTFTITAGNAGASNATGVVINDVLPAGYAFVSATPSTGIWSAPNWTIGNLANGASATLTIVATVNAAGPYANTATISGAETDPTPGNNTSTVTPVPVAQTNLSVVKTVSNPTPTVGSNVTFTITAGNAGASNATGVVINDVLPAGYAFVSATPSTGIWSAPNWTIGNLANGASATLTIVATVNAAGPYANTATISGAETDPTPGNNTSTVTPVPVAQTNLSVVKTVSNPTPTVGSNVTFTITAGNAGASNATGVVINDVLPAGYAFVSATPSTGIWSAPNWTIGNLANGASATLTIVATVNAAGPYANTATISGAETDPTPGNNTSTVTPVPVAQTNLSVVKTVSNPTPTVGSNVTFTITAGNAGASNATGVVINDVLPAGYAFVSATPSTGIWSAPNWTIGNLANGASATLTIVATVNAAGPYANTATISGAETDPTPGNNTSTVTPVPVAQTNLSVVKTVSNPTPNVGSNVTFTITAGNAGASNATGVVINDVLPAGYAFVSATPSTGTWSAPNWTIGNLANGASATLTIVATVNAAGPYANTATISGAETDPTPGNNTSTVTPVPVAQTNLSVVKTVSNPTPTVGSNVTFTITAGNAGASNATGVVINDVLPAGYAFVSATPSTGIWSAPNWTIGNLANGASATLTIVATVNAAGPYANTATISGAETDPTPGNNTSTVTPVPVAQTNLSVVKTVSNPTPTVGSNVTFTITAGNAGASNATGVVINDVLPAGYAFVSATPSTGIWSAPNWTIGNLANGASATLTIVATVNAAGPYANTATISGAETDPTPGNNTSTVTPVPVAQTNLSVVKTVSNPTPTVGSNVTFTITAGNAGASNATGVVINDVLPAGYAFVSATPSTGIWSAPNWTIGNLANGASATLTIVATVNAAGPYANTATISGAETDPTPGNNTSTVTPVPVAQTNLSVVKTVSNPTPTVGSNVTFTITAGNAGASNATGVVINDVLPAGYAFVSATPSTGIWSAPNWTIGNLANGASATLTIVATVNAAGPYANTATISGAETDPTPGNNTSTVTPVPVAQTNLSVVKTVSNPTPTVGSNVTFTITAGNAGASNATGVVINDVLPAGYAFVSATPSTGIWSAPNWTIGNLANGASATLTIVATVNAAGPYANTATISGAETDPTPGNNTSTVTPVPVAQTNLSVVKTVSNPTPTVGSNVTFTITAGNAGASNATGVVINDVLPAGYAFVSATPSTGIWSAPNWTIGNLANGASATLTIVATVNAAGPYANTATISGAETDPTPGNNTSTVTPVPVAQTNLSVVKTVSNPTPTVGSNVTFTITAGNAGASNATGVVINDVLPAGYAFVSATPSTGIWSAPNWTIGNLANGASATLTIVATVNAAGPYANTATISGAETDPTPGNNTSTVTPVPVAQTNLSVVKTVSNPTPNVGSNVTFTITAGNAGASNATGVVINDVLPAGYAFVSATPSTGTWSAPNWTIGNLANGASATLTIVATVNAAGPYANTATISGAETDPTPGNNTSTVTPVPVAQTNLSVVKTVSNPTPTVGSNVTFTITAGNAGASNATGVVINDVLPAGYAFVSATPSTGIWSAPNWTIGNLANGASATLTIVATVNAAGPYANTATISGAETDPTPGNNTSTVTPVPVAQTNLSVVKTVSNPTPTVGSNVTFTITAGNAGASNATGVVINDVLPAGYAFVSATPSTGIWSAPNWTIGNLANGASATLTIVATVNAAGPYANTATISGAETDPTPGNNTSTVTPVPVAQTNLSVVKTVSNPTPTVGSNVTFTITAGNAGASNATGVVINDVLPAGYAFVSATPSTGIWSAPNWTIGNLANGASATLTIVATVNAAGPYANTATISGAETDPTPGNNTSTVTPVPVAQTNLSVVKTVSNPTPTVGSNVTFTITAGNAGASNATGVVINDVLPAGYAFVSATPSTGIWSAPNWTIGNLANGASATLTIVATVNAAGPYANTATISGAETDPVPGNNTSTASTIPINIIDAVVDALGPINGNSGGTTIPLTANDTLNGNPVVIGTNPGQVILTPVSVPVGLILNPDGTVTVNPNTPAGSYNVEYTICEVTNPGNCDTVISVVTVIPAVIDAVVDTLGPINGNSGGTTIPLTANDTLNGNPVVIGTNPGQVVLTPVSVPVGLILNPDGTVTVNPNTPAGSYNVEYTICEVTNPGNCDTVISVVTVIPAVIDAVVDALGPINGNSGGTTIPLTANDTLNGNPVVIGTNPGQVILTPVSVPVGLILNPDGTVTVNPNTPAGSYNVEYTICEVTNPGNCDTVISVVTVIPAVIDAVVDTLGPINGNSGGTTIPLTANDTLNGNPVVIGTNPGQVILTPVSVPVGLILNPDGTVTVNPNTPAGSYNVEYTICEVTNPGNCDTVISVVTVIPAVIDAVVDTLGPINGNSGGTTIPLTANDTLNGNPVVIGTNPGQVILTPVSVPVGLILNPDGTVTVNPNTPAGSYNVEYTICEVTNPGNCDTVISVVTVIPAVIDAVVDTLGPINGNSGGTTIPLTANDTLNGNPVVIGTNPGQVVLTPVSVPVGLILNPDGTVTVNPNTPAGSYNVEYTICEVTNPGNCDTVISVVTVIPAVIDAVVDALGPINGNSGGTTIPLTANDTLNGNPVVIGTNPGQVILTPVSVPVGLILNPDGTVTVNPNTPAGSYNVEYTICEVTNPGNCDTVISVVTVIPAVIDAVVDTLGPINGNSGGTTIPLTANDTLNGNPVVIGTNPGQVILTPVSVPVGLILNPDGTVTVNPNTPAGSYNVEYTICEVTNPGNCDTVISVVTVIPAVIDAVVDTLGPINGNSGGTTIPLTANDTLNGNPVVIGTNPGQVILTPVSVPVGLILNPDGTVTVNPNTPAGSYNVEYTICEVTNPGNCDTVISVVTVSAAIIEANDDSVTMTSGSSGSIGIINVLENDTFDGNSIDLTEITLTIDATDPTNHITLNPDGSVDVAPGTPAGTYQITYTICEDLNPGNCSTAVLTVIVGTIDDIDIYTHMTPNGDGDNDEFFIDGINKYPDNTVEIYNRWGVLVYHAKGYNNQDVAFRGVSDGRTTVNASDNLPEGTYYYIVRYKKDNGESKEKAAYLYINR